MFNTIYFSGVSIMPYRRKQASKQKRRRVVRKRRAARASQNGVIHLMRKCPEQNIYNTAVTAAIASSGSVMIAGTPYQTPAFAGSTYYNVPFNADFALSDLLSPTELTVIADKYKINSVKIKMFCTSNTASAAGTAQLPSIIYTVDGDDAVMPLSSTAGLNVLRERMNTKVKQFNHNGKPLSVTIKPKIARELYNAGGAAVGAEVTSSRFINCSYPDIPHYGLKGYLQDVNLASTASVYTQFKFDITMSVTLRDIQ